MEPLAKLAVMTIGSISGVKPTPTLSANTPASSQSPSVKPLIRKTMGTSTNMRRMSNHEMLFISRSKEVGSSYVLSVCSMAPILVSSPTTSTSALARPEITLVPIKASASDSSKLSASFVSHLSNAIFSTASLSPVKPDCCTKKSRESKISTSAGNISPALKRIMSPTTNSVIGISCSFPSRITVTVLTIIRERLLAALSLRNSCTKRILPDNKTRTTIMINVVGSS